MIIQDGTGNGHEAAVDDTNRLLTRCVTESGDIEATELGDHYALTSGAITLTSTSASAMLFFKNNENYPLYVDRVIINTDDSTGGTVDQFILTITYNPEGLSSGSGDSITQVNTNLGSNNTLDLTSEKGLEGASVTGGSVAGAWRIENPTRMRVIPIRWWMPKGSSVAISYTPPAGNTSMVAVCALNAHLVKHS